MQECKSFQVKFYLVPRFMRLVSFVNKKRERKRKWKVLQAYQEMSSYDQIQRPREEKGWLYALWCEHIFHPSLLFSISSMVSTELFHQKKNRKIQKFDLFLAKVTEINICTFFFSVENRAYPSSALLASSFLLFSSLSLLFSSFSCVFKLESGAGVY